MANFKEVSLLEAVTHVAPMHFPNTADTNVSTTPTPSCRYDGATYLTSNQRNVLVQKKRERERKRERETLLFPSPAHMHIAGCDYVGIQVVTFAQIRSVEHLKCVKRHFIFQEELP